ncbi:hypothetical protein FG93_03115 [Bosea sp. LC85]|uniref:DUF917 domain-containing protein n=1 Tax=Bosea sp. LC85 TaxID=1502851 RepID=UPI0004E38348|nr:DUF917 family protein [Bosea sp. LC85]KFC70100.1 hypothetical protein FG93_03115 [Bosea sp. LC85]
MGRFLTIGDVEAAIAGGSIFAAGGGGWAEHGRMLGTAAVMAGRPELVSIEEAPDDAIIATAAAIGAPAGTTEWEMQGVDYVRAVQLLQEALGKPVYGLIIGQNGMSSTLNAWLPSALLGVKVIDAVGDIRAHPTGDMGSIGLANSPEATIQTAVGGNRAKNSYIELVTRGATGKVSPILRTASDMSGGFIASCRNPVPAAYVRKHAALGGISMALTLGERILAATPKGGPAIIDAICDEAGGAIIGRGTVVRKAVQYTSEAFDIGTIQVGSGAAARLLHVMNEYMAVTDLDGARLASYPDVITTLDADGRPVSVGHVTEGMELSILRIAKDRIPLSSSVTDPSVYPIVEKALGMDFTGYALG